MSTPVTGSLDSPGAAEQLAAQPPARRRRGGAARWVSEWAILIPFVLTVGVLLVGPIVNLLLESFRSPQGGLTLDNWARTFAHPLNRRAIGSSLSLASTVATLSALIGTPLGWYLSHTRHGRSIGIAAMNVAANSEGAALAFAFITTFGQVGLVTLLLKQLGMDFLRVDIYGPLGFIMVYLYFHVPLFVLLVMPGMGIVSATLWEAAQTCGASRTRFWLHIGLPLLLPFVAAGWVLMFAWAFGGYSVALALSEGGGHIQLVTLRIGSFLTTIGAQRYVQAACLSVLLVGLAATTLLLYRWLIRRTLRWTE